MSETHNSSFKVVFLTIAITGMIIFSTVKVVNSFDITSFVLKYLFQNKVYEVKTASKNLPISSKPDETIDITQVVEIREKLKNQQFEDLNIILEEYQNLFEADPNSEYKVYDAYRAFDLTIPSYEELFKKWINRFPVTYQPYLAIAQYYYAKGWESRGYKTAKDTSEKQFKGMQFYFSKAEANLQIALSLKPDLIVGYNILIGIFNAKGKPELEDQIIEKNE